MRSEELLRPFITAMNTDGCLPEEKMKSVLADIGTALSLREKAAELKQSAEDESKKAFIEEAIQGLEDFITNMATFCLKNDIVVIIRTREGNDRLEVISAMGEPVTQRH